MNLKSFLRDILSFAALRDSIQVASWRLALSNTSQRRAVDRYRKRLAERGMARFEVFGRKTDRELIRSVAMCLVEERTGDGPSPVYVEPLYRGRIPTEG